MTSVRERHPHRVPIVLTEGSRGMKLSSHKYLVPKEHIMGDFIKSVRKQCKLNPTEGLFFMINKTMVPINTKIGQLDSEYKFGDNMLHITVIKESVFG